MRLYILEMKRVLKSRLTVCLFGAALLLAAYMAYAPITFESFDYKNEQGEQVTKKGREALEYERRLKKEYTGELTPDKISRALSIAQDIKKQYGDRYDEGFPEYIAMEKLFPVYFISKKIGEIYADAHSGMAADIMELSPGEMEGFYGQCKVHLADLMDLEQKEHPAAKQEALRLFEKVKTPYVYYVGYGTNSVDYLGLYLYLLLCMIAIFAAPIFVTEYETGADDILRCTRHGRVRLAVVKVLSAFTVCTVLFAMCMAVHTVVANTLFGWESMQTSMQILYSAVNLWGLSVGQLQNLAILAGFLTMAATLSFTLFLSANCKKGVQCMALSFGFCLLPVILYYAADVNWLNWFRCLLPASGAGLSNSFIYALIDYKFLHIGSKSFWMPHVMLFAAGAEILLFIGLTVYCYNKKME